MYIKVRAIPSSKKEKVERKSENHYVIAVREKAERNLANNRICEIIASLYKIPRSSVRIINGNQSPSKILSIRDF